MIAGRRLTQLRATVRRYATHTCTIERQTAGATDPLGNPTPGEWRAHLSVVPCTLWAQVGPGEDADERVGAVLASWQLTLPANLDITEADRVTHVTSLDGVVWDTRPLNIRQVVRRQTHTLLTLEEAR